MDPYVFYDAPDLPDYASVVKKISVARSDVPQLRAECQVKHTAEQSAVCLDYMGNQTLLERTSSSYFSISEYQLLQGQTLLRTQNSAQTSPRGMSLYSSCRAKSLE